MKNVFILLILIISSSSFANESMIGLGAGSSSISNSDDGIKKSGTSFELKGIYSIDTNNFNYDLGLGYHHNQVKGDLNPGTIKITTKSAFAEVDAKYKISKNIYLGPGIKVLTGTDSSFKELEGSSNTNSLVGLKGQYDFLNQNSLNYRIEASIYSTTQSSQNLIALIGINFGFKNHPTKIIQARIEPPLRLEEKQNEEVADIKVILKSARVLFNTDAYQVDALLSSKLIKLAKYLNQENENWARVKISGHTDNQGSFEYNKDLSQKRSDSIKNILTNNGVDPKKLESISYSYLRPISTNNTEEGRSKNRRTEIEFYGIKNREEFNRKIVEILQ